MDIRTSIAATVLGGLVQNERFWLANDAQAIKEGIKTTEVFARDALKLTDALMSELGISQMKSV